MVVSQGRANQKLKAFVTQTISPLSKVLNPDSLLINDALIDIYENNILVDTMTQKYKGVYQSNIYLKENKQYYISAFCNSFDKVKSKPDTVPFPANLLDVTIENIYPEKDSHKNYKIFIDFTFTVKKSHLYPYNNLTINYFSNGQVYEDYLILSSKSDFLECDNCFNLLDNPCTINKGNNILNSNRNPKNQV